MSGPRSQQTRCWKNSAFSPAPTCRQTKRFDPLLPPFFVTPAILDDESYLAHLTELLSGASSRVDVAMFYIAMPGPGHPTRALMEQLVSAKARGVIVRVLVDRDRDDDPYGSSLINADAVSFLAENGIQIRVDAPDRLLHSKFVVADEAWAVLGSHNWTAGSYYRYQDSSIALMGGAMPQRLHERFDVPWQRGEVP
ncbi:MAG: phospholipase D-like domain-containing protein [Myxococcota bacterium]